MRRCNAQAHTCGAPVRWRGRTANVRLGGGRCDALHEAAGGLEGGVCNPDVAEKAAQLYEGVGCAPRGVAVSDDVQAAQPKCGVLLGLAERSAVHLQHALRRRKGLQRQAYWRRPRTVALQNYRMV